MAGRRPLISGNWKMHHDHIEALHMLRDLGLRLKPEDVAAVDVSVHPPFTDLRTVQTLVEKEAIPVQLGAQHCSDEDAGARTGEVSPHMLARLLSTMPPCATTCGRRSTPRSQTRLLSMSAQRRSGRPGWRPATPSRRGRRTGRRPKG